MGDLAGSEHFYRLALDIDPHDSASSVGLAQTLRWQGRMADAWRVIEPIVRAEPSNEDARVQADCVAASFRPRVRTAAIHERDSDGNLVSAITFGGSVRLADPVDVHADAWLRDAGLRGPGRSRTASGGLIGARWETNGPALVRHGWSL